MIPNCGGGTFRFAFEGGRDGDRMARAAVTFDFHNTIAQCDEWFDIEVKGLISAFLRWQSDDRGIPIDHQTLWSSDHAYGQLRQAVREHGIEMTAEECVATVLDELSLSYDVQEIARGMDQLMRPKVDLAEPMPGAIETIHDLALAGVPLGIVSSAVYHPFLLWTLEQFGIAGAFGTVTTSASAGFYKSRPEIYLSALVALDATPQRSVHIGDSRKYDVGGAQSAGMRTVWLAPEPQVGQEDGTQPAPDLTLPTLLGSAPHILNLLASVKMDFESNPAGAVQ